MEEQIMNNEEVMESVVVEVIEESGNKIFKTLGVIGIGALVGVGAYKYLVKPLAAKIKAKKEEANAQMTGEQYDSVHDESREEE